MITPVQSTMEHGKSNEIYIHPFNIKNILYYYLNDLAMSQVSIELRKSIR